MSFTCSFHQVCFQPSRRIRFCKMKKKTKRKKEEYSRPCETGARHALATSNSASWRTTMRRSHATRCPIRKLFLSSKSAKSNCIYSTRFCFVLRFFEYRGSEILGTLEDIYLLVSHSSFRYFAIIRSLLTVFDRLFIYICLLISNISCFSFSSLRRF